MQQSLENTYFVSICAYMRTAWFNTNAKGTLLFDEGGEVKIWN